MAEGKIVIVGATQGIGRRLAETYAARGRDVVVTGRDAERAAGVAAEIGERATSAAFDLAKPETIAEGLRDVGSVGGLVVAALERDENSIREYDVERAVYLVTLKLVGYTATVHTLLDRMTPEASILLFGGQAFRIPYPGSTTVTTVNGGVEGLVTTMVVELAPRRVNAIHPGIVGDSPYWDGKPDAVLEGHTSKTITKKLATMDEIVDGTRFLLENPSVEGIDLVVDNGRMMF